MVDYCFHFKVPHLWHPTSLFFFLNSKANLKMWKNKMEHSDPKSSVYVAGN